MKLSLLVLSLLVWHISSQSFEAILALSWPEAHCQDLRNKGRTCDAEQYRSWDHKSFTIHGLWPNTGSNQNFGAFDVKAVKSIEKELKTFWPPRSDQPKSKKPSYGESYSLWIHEWKVHGKDFAQEYLNAFKGTARPSNVALQALYFRSGLDALHTIRGSRLAGNPTTKGQLAGFLGIDEKSFSIRCLNSTMLQQVRVCMSATKTAKAFNYRPIHCKKMSSNCAMNFVLSKYI